MWRAGGSKASAWVAREAIRQQKAPVREQDWPRMTDEKLKSYRQSIDNIDAALVCLLAERFKITQAVGRYKAEAGLPPADLGREAAQIGRLRDLARSADLDPDFSEKFLRFIIDEVIRHHERARESA
jgi:chorismate mutase